MTGDDVINSVDAPEITSGSTGAETIADVPAPAPLLDSILLSRHAKPVVGRKFFPENLVWSLANTSSLLTSLAWLERNPDADLAT